LKKNDNKIHPVPVHFVQYQPLWEKSVTTGQPNPNQSMVQESSKDFCAGQRKAKKVKQREKKCRLITNWGWRALSAAHMVIL